MNIKTWMDSLGLRSLSNLRLTSKLLVSPIIAVAFLVIFGIVCYAGFLKQKTALDDVFDKRLDTINLLTISRSL